MCGGAEMKVSPVNVLVPEYCLACSKALKGLLSLGKDFKVQDNLYNIKLSNHLSSVF